MIARLLLLAGLAVGLTVGSAGAAADPSPRLARVVVVVMENKVFGEVIGSRDAPYITGLARRYALATGYYGVTHPSLPNYLALLSGSTFGITTDCTDCGVDAPNLVDELERRKISWRAYMGGMRSPCFVEPPAGLYVKKHDPFVYFQSVVGDPTAVRQGRAADRALRRSARQAAPPTAPPALGPRGVLFVTWDKAGRTPAAARRPAGGRIPTIAVGPAARRRTRSGRPFDHYSLLRTIEDGLGLRRLGASAGARPLTPLLRSR